MITKTNINEIIDEIHDENVKAGWHHDIVTGKQITNVPEKMMLMVSEISEALEAFRKDLKDDKLPQYNGVMVELADLFIRMGDLLGYLKTQGYEADFDQIIYDKRLFNAERPDHKKENRLGANGKKF